MAKHLNSFLRNAVIAVLSFSWNFAFAQGIETKPHDQARSATPANQETVAPVEPVNEEAALPQEAAQPKGWEELKDPFEPYLPTQEKAEETSGPNDAQQAEASAEEFDYSSLVVTGIVWGTENPKAIINGNVQGKGDTVNEAQIIDISKEGILFKYKDKEYLMKRQSAAVN